MPSLLISVNKNGLLLARAMINLNKEEIPLRIVNVNDTHCTIYKGTIVATCEVKPISSSDFEKIVWNSTKRSLYDFCWFSSKQFMPLS
jgi:hypothetical protein